jgi:hypothetical protein
MRYTRLRRQIEGGTLISRHGTPFIGGAEKIMETTKKRKELMPTEYDEGGLRAVQVEAAPKYRKEYVKFEQSESSDSWETNSSENVNSEDKIPLAKRMLYRSGCFASISRIEAVTGGRQFSEVHNFSKPTHEIYHPSGAGQLYHYQPMSPLHDPLSKVLDRIQQHPSLFSPEKEVTTQFDIRSAWNTNLQSLETSPSATNCHSMATDKVIHGRMQNDWSVPTGMENQRPDFRDFRMLKDE